jgi:cyclopropane fatty-acyl-phospholipid synthase-like methyltransferase
METQEKQYQFLIERLKDRELGSLGMMTSQGWDDDPKRLVFTLSRYKFVAKMLDGRKNVLEVGCADAFASRIVKQHVSKLTVSDFDPIFMSDVNSRMNPEWLMDVAIHDMVKGPMDQAYDAAYALDVLEHIQPEDENAFIKHICASLTDDGVLIFGMPSLESQPYASPASKEGHVNCKTMPDFKEIMSQYFNSVFMFSMNDEVIHSGFHKMANYLMAVCSHKK